MERIKGVSNLQATYCENYRRHVICAMSQ